MAAPLAGAIMERWLTDGTVKTAAAAIREEAASRRALAEAALGLPLTRLRRGPRGFRLWLAMAHSRAECLAEATAAPGVLVTTPRAVRADPAGEDGGVRLCLGAPPGDALEDALLVLKGLIDHGPAAALDRTRIMV